MAMIHEKIPKVMEEIGAIGKDRKNPQQGYAFRGIDDVYNAVNTALSKHEIFCVPTVLKMVREERQTKAGGSLLYTILDIKYTFYASDGSSFDCVTVGEAMDSGDKSCNKAMSAAQKYAFFQVFSIPTEEPKDTEHETHVIKQKTPSTVQVAEEKQEAPTSSQGSPVLNYQQLHDKVITSKNSFELQARWKKYADSIKLLSEPGKKELSEVKDKMKKMFEVCTGNTSTCNQTLVAGNGDIGCSASMMDCIVHKKGGK